MATVVVAGCHRGLSPTTKGSDDPMAMPRPPDCTLALGLDMAMPMI